MKKLLQIEICKNTLSTGHDTENIGKVAIDKGWESWKAYSCRMRTNIPSASHTIEVGNKFDVFFHLLETRMFDNHSLGMASILPTKKLIRKIGKIKPDIIVLHDIKGYWLNLKVLFKYFKTLNIPIVWALHDCWPFTGHCAHFSLAKCNKWQTECNDCPLKRDYPQSWFVDNSRKNYKLKKELFCSVKNMTLIAVSNWLKEIAEKSFLNKYPIHAIYNGIDTETFKYRPELKDKWADKKIILGVASRWSKDKGLFDYIALAKLLSKDFQIVLVGHIDENNVLNSLPQNITHIERTENAIEMAEYYSRADVSVSMSYQETMGLTTVEAMACGTPGIVYNATASPELITPETGIVVELGDTKAMLSAILEITNNGKDKYSEACRKRAVDTFDKKVCFEQYIDIFDKLL